MIIGFIKRFIELPERF